MTVVAWDRRCGLYFADVELIVSSRGHPLGVAGSAVGDSATEAIARCYSEFYERWCQLRWELAGEVLITCDLLTGEPNGTVLPAQQGRPDSTGSCAHSLRFERAALIHGLLEVVERDAVVRLLDRRTARTARVPLAASPAVARTADRWGVSLQSYAVLDIWSSSQVHTVVAVARGNRGGGALGSASHFQLERAAVAACQQALMTYTTALHHKRRGQGAGGYAALVWAADHIDELLAELDGNAASATPSFDASRASVTDLSACIQQVFGSPPKYARYPAYGLAVSDRVALRVLVDGALNPGTVSRTPWPVG